MKQLKFLMVAFTLMMGISLTSCMGESDPTISDVTFGQISSFFPTVIETPYGITFTATNTIDQDLYLGDYVYFRYSYNSEEQKVDQNTKKINAAIIIGEKIKDQPTRITSEKGEEFENATIIQIGNGANSSYKFLYYDKNKILAQVLFLGKESIDKHSFTLAFNESDIKEGDTQLKLYLRHQSSEEKPTLKASSFRMFDIESALERFSNLTGKKPTKVIVCANETMDISTDALDKKKETLTEYSMDYDFKE